MLEQPGIKILKKNMILKNFKLSTKLSKIYFDTGLCIKIINLPTSYFYLLKQNYFNLLICDKNKAALVNWMFKQIFCDLFILKLRIRGLGYRLRTISDSFHYIFFNYTNYFYLYNPLDIVIKTLKKRMLLISFFWDKLRLVICHILLLQKVGPYTLEGIRWVKQIIILKKSGKKV